MQQIERQAARSVIVLRPSRAVRPMPFVFCPRIVLVLVLVLNRLVIYRLLLFFLVQATCFARVLALGCLHSALTKPRPAHARVMVP